MSTFFTPPLAAKKYFVLLTRAGLLCKKGKQRAAGPAGAHLLHLQASAQGSVGPAQKFTHCPGHRWPRLPGSGSCLPPSPKSARARVPPARAAPGSGGCSVRSAGGAPGSAGYSLALALPFQWPARRAARLERQHPRFRPRRQARPPPGPAPRIPDPASSSYPRLRYGPRPWILAPPPRLAPPPCLAPPRAALATRLPAGSQ